MSIFSDLLDFIQHRMRMSHIYQPVMLTILINAGAAAGQTIMHSHIRLIPRRKNDVVNPRGGVRGVVPGMQSY